MKALLGRKIARQSWQRTPFGQQLVISQVGAALACIGGALFEVWAARAQPQKYTNLHSWAHPSRAGSVCCNRPVAAALPPPPTGARRPAVLIFCLIAPFAMVVPDVDGIR